jgi:hypothetical protein
MSSEFGWKTAGKCSLGLLAAVGVFLGVCQGQSSSAKYIVKKSVFHLPFNTDEASIANVREMELWVRDGTGQWKIMDRVAPTAKHFTCEVAQDGEYGFSIVMVDKSGKSTPADVMHRAPELTVLVDTKAVPSAASPAKSSLPPPTLKFSGNQPMPEVNETEEPASPVIPGQKTKNSSAELPTFSPQSLHDAVLLHDAGTSVSTVNSSPAMVSSQGPGNKVLLVNKTKVNIDYNIKKAGPSGVSKVEVYATADQGKTWECLGADAELHSPIAVQLPGEGVFGIRLLGINGNGFGGKKPGPGDRPNTIIEVDMTSPTIQGWKVATGKNGNLDVYWKVTDKNLGSTPINLYYRTKANQSWKPMALKVKNDGVYHWPISQDLAPQYFIRLEAVDQAGNRTSCDTTSPILVDRTEPDINVLGVTVVQTRADMPETLVPVESDPEN